MTPNEITTAIATPYGKQFDMGYKLQLFLRVRAWRSRLIANTLERNPQDRIHFTQTLVVPMENMDGYSVSTVDVPRPLEGSRMYYDYVGNGGPIAFMYTPAGSGLLQMNPYAITPGFDVIKSRLHVDREDICRVIIRGIMDDPSQELCDCQETDYFNSPYPVSFKIAQQIIQAITDESKTTTPPSDKSGNLTVPAEEGRV